MAKHSRQRGGTGYDGNDRQSRKCARNRKEHARLKKHERRAAKMDKRHRRRQ